MHDNILIVMDLPNYPCPMHIAILTFEGYNELDSLIALGVLNRVQNPDWRISIASPSPRVRSMNGVVIESHVSLDDASAADAVIVGSGRQTREVVADRALMAQLNLDPSRQLLGAQCSGTLVLAKLGLLEGIPACTDSISKPWVQAAGVEVLDQPLFARGNIATAGGCLSSAYLAGWLIARLESVEAAKGALHYVAPVGEKDEYVSRALGNITPYLDLAAVH
jgi:transcriptional regulator GlxA family with amidase domain